MLIACLACRINATTLTPGKFLLKKKYHIAIYIAGFIAVTYFQLNTMAVAVIGVIVAVIYYNCVKNLKVKEGA